MTNYVGDKPAGARLDGKFTTIDSNGVPTALAGATLTIFAGASTAGTTQGAAIISSFSSITGLNHWTVSTAQSAGFYTANQTYQGVLTAGTVGSSSMIGYVVCEFSLAHGAALRPTVSGRDLDVTTGGAAGVDWANVENPTTVLALTQTTISSGQTVSGVANAVWDENILLHQTINSAGRVLTLGGMPIAETTISGAATSNSFSITAGSTTNDYYNDQTVVITTGAGLGQVRIITGYTGATRTLFFDEPFITTPASSDYIAIQVQHVHPITDITAGVWDAVNNEYSTAGSTGANLLTASQAAGATSSEIATAVWSATRIANSTAGTFGEAISGVANPVTVGTNNDKTGYALSVVGASGVWDVVNIEHSAAGTTGGNLIQAANAAGATSSQIAVAVWSATRIANSTAGTFGEAISGVVNSVGSVVGNVGGSVVGGVGYVAGSVSGDVVGNVDGSVASVTAPVTVGTNNDKTGYTLTTAAYSAAATAVLIIPYITISGTAETDRNLLQATRPLRNRVDTATVSGQMTIYKEDDTTTAWTAVLSSDSTAIPITQIDPS